MNQLLNFLLQYKEYIVLGVALIGGVFFYGRKKVVSFVSTHIGDIEKEVATDISKNSPAYAQFVYGKLPKVLKAFATVNTIEKILVKFLDK